MLTRQQVLQLLKEQQPYLAAEFGVSKIGLFGSFARGQSDETSDVDLVVEFERPIGFRFVDLVECLEHLLGRPVDVLTPAGIRSIRNRNVARRITQSIEYV
jgi:predicted nucleotidyltransferase